MKKLAVILTVAVAMSVSALAQGRNLAGAWTFDAAKTGAIAGAPAGSSGPPKVFIKQTAKEISIGMGREDNIVTFNLDGSENVQTQGTSKMKWNGDKFVATVASSHGGGDQSITFYREGAWLVVEEPPHGGTVLTKMYYAKAAPAK